MKKCLLNIVMMMILCICFSGCGKENENQIEYSVIEDITVMFVSDNSNYRNVKIDFLSGEKKVTDDYGESDTETISSFEDGEKLKAFLEQTIIPEISNGKASKVAEDDENLIWRIKINTDGGSMTIYGIGEENFPTYWDELLELLGERQSKTEK